jgi:hypothetical protein
METRFLRLVDGTSALSLSSSLEAEFAQDRWDARNIPGLRYAAHSSQYHIRFGPVPDSFRPLMKAYAHYLIAAGRTVGTIDGYVRRIGHFLTFFVQRYPHTPALHALTMQDIDAFIVQLACQCDCDGKVLCTI